MNRPAAEPADAADPWETSAFDVNYSGWRNTTGPIGSMFSPPKTFGLLTVSNSEQAQRIEETSQLLANETTYREHTHEGISTTIYAVTSKAKPWLLLSAEPRDRSLGSTT